ncbi:MAG: Uncharacterised protein [SAR116 cluster bacterium]|nr:MAG: Uncharacterised protein [SAR116 cluster bacterium]
MKEIGKPTKIENSITAIMMTPIIGDDTPPAPLMLPSKAAPKIILKLKASGNRLLQKIMPRMTA